MNLGHNHYTPGKAQNWAFDPKQARELQRLARVRDRARSAVKTVYGAVLMAGGDRQKARDLLKTSDEPPMADSSTVEIANALRDL